MRVFRARRPVAYILSLPTSKTMSIQESIRRMSKDRKEPPLVVMLTGSPHNEAIALNAAEGQECERSEAVEPALQHRLTRFLQENAPCSICVAKPIDWDPGPSYRPANHKEPSPPHFNYYLLHSLSLPLLFDFETHHHPPNPDLNISLTVLLRSSSI